MGELGRGMLLEAVTGVGFLLAMSMWECCTCARPCTIWARMGKEPGVSAMLKNCLPNLEYVPVYCGRCSDVQGVHTGMCALHNLANSDLRTWAIRGSNKARGTLTQYQFST